ncbi:MAG: HEAT repeat domain-containing protein [Candidatus Heimdallarchaeaceae archaeon]
MSNEKISTEEKDTEILVEKDELEIIIEDEIEKEIEKIPALSDSELDKLIEKFKETKKKKERANLIDQFSENLDSIEVKELLIEVAEEDNYPLCRAKAVSSLGYWIDDTEIQHILLKKLTDISPKVRLWAVWTLRPIIHLRDIQENIINRVKFSEKSRQIKLWMIRILSDQIDELFIQETFLYFFKTNPDNETRKLLLYYLLPKIENEDILFTISRHVQEESNREIKLEIVKRLVLVDEPDVKYLLEKLSKTERNQEILDLISSNP